LTEWKEEKKMCSCFEIEQEKKKGKDVDDHKVVAVIMQIILASCLDVFKCY
jgi:hypothetical protein